jgi:mRNA-degrading endonuclease RelE of RelBE toxin-antitoxin system
MEQKKSSSEVLSVSKINKNKFLLDKEPKSNSKSTGISKIIEHLGNALPVIVSKCNDSDKYTILSGQNNFLETVSANYDEIPAIILDVHDRIEHHKATLNLLLNNNKESDAIMESNLIVSLLEDGLKRADIIELTGKSKSWVCRREAFNRDLHDEVKQMVSKRLLASKLAEEISKLPKDVQVQFSSKVIDDKINYIDTSNYVSTYNNKLTSDEIKELILSDPTKVPLEKKGSKKKKTSNIKNEGNGILSEDIRIAVKILSGFNKKINKLSKEEIEKIKDELNILQDMCCKANDYIGMAFATNKIECEKGKVKEQ